MLKVLKKIVDMSNSNLQKNADVLLATKPHRNEDILWVSLTSRKNRENMNLPIKVWAIILKYLRLINLVEISCVSKTFYRICEKNQYYVKKLRESKDIFKDRSWLIETYEKLLERFYSAVYREVVVNLPISQVHVFRKEIYSRLYYSLLPFRVWNHVF